MTTGKKYFSIGEISKIFNILIETIRYYDEIGLLKPAHVDFDTNYKYYSVDQFVLIDIIRNSKQMGMPLKEIQEYVEGVLNTEDIVDLIDRQLDFMNAKIDNLLKARNSMEGIRNLILLVKRFVYEHIYLNDKFYTWHCTQGIESGLCDTDRCYYLKLEENLYWFA